TVRPKRLRRFALPVAAAVAGVVTVTVVVAQQRPTAPAPAPAAAPPAGSVSTTPVPTAAAPDVRLMSAVQVLTRAADLTVGAADQPVGPGQFRYVAEHTWVQRGVQTGDGIGYTYLWEQEVDRWIP